MSGLASPLPVKLIAKHVGRVGARLDGLLASLRRDPFSAVVWPGGLTADALADIVERMRVHASSLLSSIGVKIQRTGEFDRVVSARPDRTEAGIIAELCEIVGFVPDFARIRQIAPGLRELEVDGGLSVVLASITKAFEVRFDDEPIVAHFAWRAFCLALLEGIGFSEPHAEFLLDVWSALHGGGPMPTPPALRALTRVVVAGSREAV